MQKNAKPCRKIKCALPKADLDIFLHNIHYAKSNVIVLSDLLLNNKGACYFDYEGHI